MTTDTALPSAPGPEDSVTDLLAQLDAAGYAEELVLRGGCLVCPSRPGEYGPEDIEVVATYRFEGPSDPGDETIVAALRHPEGWRGVLVSAYGNDMEAADAEFLAALARPRR